MAMGAGVAKRTRLGLGAAGVVLITALAGCEREVILEGERFDTRVALDATVPVEGQPAPLAADFAPKNVSQPISLPGAVANADWTHRGGSARHSGAHGALSAAPVRVWSAGIGAGNSKRNRVTSAPVVSGGKVFVMDARQGVSALSTGGGLIWKADLTPEFDGKGSELSGGGLAVAGATVYATTGYGELVALDAASGALRWRQRFDAPVIGAPAVEGGKVFAVGRDGTAMAVAADTGKILWEVPGTRSASGMAGTGTPAVADGSVIFPFASGEVSAIDMAEGTRQWGAAVAGRRLGRAYAAANGDITGDPVVSGGVVYVGTAAGRTAALDAKTGERLWTANEGALNPPLVVGGSVFVVSDESHLVRLDATTGAVIWSVPMPYYVKDKPAKLKAITASFGPVLAGGRIVVAASDGQLRLFNPADGTLVGGADIPGGAASPMALAGGMLFVVGGNGQLHAFR